MCLTARTIDHDGEETVVEWLQAGEAAGDDLMHCEVYEVGVCASELRQIGVGVLEEGLVQPYSKVPLPTHQQDGEDANMKLTNLAWGHKES